MTIKGWRPVAGAQRAVRRFTEDRRGGVAVTVGLSFPVLAFAALVGIDYSHASMAKQQLQETLDASTLLVARSTAIEADAVDKLGDDTFKAQLASGTDLLFTADQNGRFGTVTFAPVGTKITGEATATVEPLVANLFMKDGLTITATSEVQRTVNKLEIALVLDTTGSMESNDKIGKLKTAATDFLTQMETASKRATVTDPIKIAIVPFSTTVKVSDPIQLHKSAGITTEYNEATFSMTGLPAWLDGRGRGWADAGSSKLLFDTAARDRFALLKQMGVKWGGCVEARQPPYDIREDAPTTVASPSTEQAKTLFTPYFWPDEPDPKAKNKNGDFGTFKNDYLTDKAFSTSDWKIPQRNVSKYALGSDATKFKKTGTFSLGTGYGAALTYGPNAGCNMQKIQTLTKEFTTLKSTVTNLVASGETNIPLGLMWGWHALSPNAPLANGISYLQAETAPVKTSKIIILMTDGDNTMYPNDNNNDSWYHGYGFQWQERLGVSSTQLATRTGYMNNRLVPAAGSPASTEALCKNIKAPRATGSPEKIQIYVIGVGISETNRTLLRKCATSEDYYFDVDATGSNLSSTFSAIAGKIENLRLTK